METFKKYSANELEITPTSSAKPFIESIDTTLALLTEVDEKITELNALREVLSARYNAGVQKGLKTRYEVDEENRLAEIARQEALKKQLDED